MKRALAIAGVGLFVMGGVYLVGCGGGSGSTSLASTGRATVLITDGFREDYAHVWATIYHVELIPQAGTNGGANVVVFDNPAGVTVDLKTLRDSTGAIFSFLGGATIPAGTYTAAAITVGPTMQLFLKGATTGTTYPVDSSIPKNSAGNPVLTDTFKSPKTVGSTPSNVIIDFNLANFVVRNSKILPVVQDGDPAGVSDSNRHCVGEYFGTVSALTGTAPVLTFTLTSTTGSTQTVVTTASTSLFGATLANGSAVEVSGTLDTTTQNLVSTRVEVLPAGTSAPGSGPSASQRAAGAASAVNSTAGTFTLTVSRAGGFTPATTTITVAVTSTTVLRGDTGAVLAAADFYTALATTPNVQVEGTYDSTTSTFTATGISIENTSNDGGWEHDHHDFRPGANAGNWGNDAMHHH